jgi:hypothetical protein
LKKLVKLLEKCLLVNRSGNFFSQADVIRTGLNNNRFEEGVNVLRDAASGTTIKADITI